MTDKAYIVVNEEQEREVLGQLEREGYLWRGTDMRPTEKHRLIDEPITIFARDDKRLTFDYGVNEAYLADYEIEIDFGGRKESKMSEKYVVSQEFMNELEEWRSNLINNFVGYVDLGNVPVVVAEWWKAAVVDTLQTNNRLIAIIRWVNGEDVFEVEKPKKFIVRSNHCDSNGLYQYVESKKYGLSFNISDIDYATRFDTKEEAQSWANDYQEVVEVVDV